MSAPLFPALVPVALALAFAGILFGIAFRVERQAASRPQRWRTAAYAMALSVYCSSWTFYGAVGSAATQGWDYLPIYLGPILLFALAPRLLQRLVSAAQAEAATSISDFIGARFGRSGGVAALVTLTAMLALIPYIALQLRSVGIAFAALSGGGVAVGMAGTAILLTVFAMLFGTRRYDAAGRSEGLLFATAFESLVKLGALMLLCVGALVWLAALPSARVHAATLRLTGLFAPAGVDADLVVLTILSMGAVLCLPRQFLMGVIEARQPGDIVHARWPFVLYLTAFSVLVLPITLAGVAMLPPGAPADLYVLSLPVAAGTRGLALVAFLGGFSAATAMVVVESVALATMISNDIVAPVLLRTRRFAALADVGAAMLMVRRVGIAVVVSAALAWALVVPSDASLAEIGHIAFAAVVQIAPLLLLAIDGRVRDPLAAKLGLAIGLAGWLWLLALPQVLPAGWTAWLTGSLLDPAAPFGWNGATVLVRGVLLSLGANVAAIAAVAARSRPPAGRDGSTVEVTDLSGLIDLVSRFVGEGKALALLTGGADRALTRRDLQRAERAIAGVVGVPSARALIGSAVGGARLGYEDVARMLDEGGQSLRFSKGLLAATLEHIEPGVSVVDADQRLVAWNSRYLDLFAYPEGMVAVGTPIEQMIRFNAERGECGPGEVEAHVARRLEHLRRGTVHDFERVRSDGRVVRTAGGPMPGGGYVMCFTDITAEARTRTALQQVRAGLEVRVAERTAELMRLNGELARATRDKTRFLAAASHDLIQPLHAARLFAAALGRETGHPHVERIDQAIGNAEQLLRALLDISRLDAGGVEPAFAAVPLGPLIADVCEGLAPLAQDKGLRLRVGAHGGVAWSDPVLLASVLRNLVGNAIRYTPHGGVLVGVRARGDGWRLDVVDTGIGIAADQLEAIFGEFHQVERGGSGIGLGLAIVDRTATLLKAQVRVASTVGRGSRFSIELPAARHVPRAATRTTVAHRSGQHVLVIDDDSDNAAAMIVCLRSLAHVAQACAPADAIARARAFSAAFVDYHLGDGTRNGLALIRELRLANPTLRCALVTADASSAVRDAAAGDNVSVLLKPLGAGPIAAWLDA